MKRTPLVRKTPLRAKKPMKKSRPKTTPIRKSAKGEECTLRLLGVCCGDSSTVVWAHSNSQAHGHGMGLKASDEYGCYACFACHDALDGRARPSWLTQERIRAEFERAMLESRLILQKKGLLAA